MKFVRYLPAYPLGRYVECFWWSRRDEPLEHAEHMLPSGRAQLVFALHDNPILWSSESGRWMSWSRSIVHGAQTSFYIAGPKPKGVTVGISFRAGAAGAVLGASMAELSDRHVGLDAIWGRRGVELHERLMSAVEPEQVFRILEQNLSARIHRPLLMHPAVAQALASHPDASSPVRVGELHATSGYSPKHFIALFRGAVGLSPKHFFRIQRFNSVVRNMAAQEGSALSGLAAAAGYADQAHLTREFREFAGVTPTRYRPCAQRPLHHRAG